MSAVIDHLQSDHRVRVLRDFRDARGLEHRAGEEGIIRRMDCDFVTFAFVIEWERDGAKEELIFDLKSREGPGSGRMREYFAMEDYVPSPEYTREARTRRKAEQLQRSTPAVVEEPVSDPARYEDAVARIWALAARHRFDEANEQIRLVLDARISGRDRLEQLAGDMIGITEAFLNSSEAAVYDWLRERTIDLWYAWGSRATSGGEGAAMARYIRAAEERLPRRQS